MADLSKPKRRLGAPPPREKTSSVLKEPGTAPAPPKAALQLESEGEAPAPRKKFDARSLRKTGRTEQFATRVKPEFKERFHGLAARDGKMIAEILEESLALYERRHGKLEE